VEPHDRGQGDVQYFPNERKKKTYAMISLMYKKLNKFKNDIFALFPL
jgi:hypothetical protein